MYKTHWSNQARAIAASSNNLILINTNCNTSLPCNWAGFSDRAKAAAIPSNNLAFTIINRCTGYNPIQLHFCQANTLQIQS